MNYKKIFTLVLLFVNLTGIAMANTGESISIDSVSMDAGSTYLVQVQIENAVEIAGMSFDLNFDPAVINIKEVSSSSEVPDSAVNANIDNDAGNVNVVLTNTNLISSTESVPIVNIIVSAIGDSDGKTQLTFANVEFTDITFVPFTPSVITDGSVEIEGTTVTSTSGFSSSAPSGGNEQNSDTESVIIEESVLEKTEEISKAVVSQEDESSIPAYEQESQSTPFLGILTTFILVMLASRFK